MKDRFKVAMKFDIPEKHQIDYRLFSGLAMIFIGASIFLDRSIETGWMSYFTIFLFGCVLLYLAVLERRLGLLVFGSLSGGIGLGLFFAFSPMLQFAAMQRAGLAVLSLGIAWVLVPIFSHLFIESNACWALIPGSVLIGTGMSLTNSVSIYGYVLLIVTGLGLAFILWGTLSKLIGLIIPGSILVGVGPGIYLGWSDFFTEPNAVARTGIMLVFFGLGWALITVFSRKAINQFIWWPLIPAGVIAVTGWGLYIGGNPSHAAEFISNTGSLTLVIFGCYVLLLRQGFKR